MINTAIFKKIKGKVVLLCSKCGDIIKTEKDFDVLEKYAYNGVTTLTSRYCSKHKHLDSYGNQRREIREKLKEGIMKTIRKNIFEVEISRPTQELIIMRGIPGSGKSTKANKIVAEGIIHSTDALVEATGDYNAHFAKMVELNDWSAHGRMHKRCFLDAKASMKEGISPVIVDNTNIKPKEARNYVEAALKLGLDENNIRVVDVGNGGCTAEELFKRNTHNVPLRVVERMMQSHASVGELTIDKILKYRAPKQMTNESNYNDSEITTYNAPKVLYAGVMLDDKSKSILLEKLNTVIPQDWKKFAHHMTIVFGKGLPDKSEVGKIVSLTVTEIGISDMAIAVKVEGYPTTNAIPHITVAVNTNEGGKPFMSNKITDWEPLRDKFHLSGVVKEVTA